VILDLSAIEMEINVISIIRIAYSKYFSCRYKELKVKWGAAWNMQCVNFL
jgi:hypothetical protein